MGNIPKINTQYVNGFIGENRPIYGNQVLPPSPTPTISLTPSPTPVYYYYELQDCSGPGYGFIRTETTFLSGHIGKSLYTLERGCMEVFATATTTNDLLTWAPSYALYADCSACAFQYTPTPTPTPPVTPTISLTPSITPSVSASPVGLTPTPTPTPSPSGYQYIYEVVNCDDGVDVRRFASNSVIPLDKVVKGLFLPECYIVLGTTTGPYDDVVINQYTSCVSCPR